MTGETEASELEVLAAIGETMEEEDAVVATVEALLYDTGATMEEELEVDDELVVVSVLVVDDHPGTASASAIDEGDDHPSATGHVWVKSPSGFQSSTSTAYQAAAPLASAANCNAPRMFPVLLVS